MSPVALKEALDFISVFKFQGKMCKSCIFAALTVRDVLRRLGHHAEVRSVGLLIQAARENVPLGMVGVGINALIGEPYTGSNWDGHLVVTVGDWLIDPTFGNYRRQHWEWIPDVAIVTRDRSKLIKDGARVIAQLQAAERDCQFEANWIARGRNTGWRGTPVARPAIRRDMIDEIVHKYWPRWSSAPSG